MSLLILELIDLDRHFYLSFQTFLFFSTLCVLLIYVILYTFSETIASECSTLSMAPHICWFLCARTRSRHGLGNRLVVYLGESRWVQPTSSRRLALDFTSCYRYSPYYAHLICRNFTCLHSAVAETTIKQRTLSCILIDLEHWGSRLGLHQHGKHLRHTRDTKSVPHTN